MHRREIRTAAKELVAHSGPFNVLEFGEELIQNYADHEHPHWINREEIMIEARRQADRVLDFLGL